jgi:hypothetical protein
MKLRRICASMSILTSVILLSGFAGANADSSSIAPTKLSSDPSFTVNIGDNHFYNPGEFSSITGTLPGGNNTNLECSSVTDPKCALASGINGGKGGFQITVVIPPCPANYDSTDVCVRTLKTADSTGVLQNATLEYEANTNKFAKDIKNELPAGGGASVWKGASAKGGTLDYAVVVSLLEFWRIDSATKKPIREVERFQAQVVPVKIKTGNYYPTYWTHLNPSDSNSPISAVPQIPSGAPQPDSNDCLIVDLGRCAQPESFFVDQNIQLTLQMDNIVTGWLYGRMKDTKVSATPLSKSTNLLIVEGKSINVPTGQAIVPLSAINSSPGLQQMNSEYAENFRTTGILDKTMYDYSSNRFELFSFAGTNSKAPDPKLYGSGMFNAVEPWLKTIQATPTWNFSGEYKFVSALLDQSTANNVWNCTVNDKSKLHGFITTNAMASPFVPPALKDGFLTYKVAGAHFDVDGSVYKGTYNLSMNAESAKCIYGFTDAPIQATVSVTKESGETTNIATELLTIQNGWLNLSANNFTFSDPTIRIKLTQEKSAVKPTPTASATPTPTPKESKVAASKITITCIKGKLKKVVSGSKPVCPVGYKKK